MRTTIDSAGRIVVPKALRDAMKLTPGQAIEIVYTDGRLEIDVAPTPVRLADRDGWPVAEVEGQHPPLSGSVVREVLEDTRR